MTTASQMIKAAESHLGEGPWPTWNWWNRTQYQAGSGWPWCAAFQSKIATECGLKHTDSPSASGFANQFTRVNSPKMGDIVTFNWDGRTQTNWMDHVALVTGVGQNCFYTIDTNYASRFESLADGAKMAIESTMDIINAYVEAE